MTLSADRLNSRSVLPPIGLAILALAIVWGGYRVAEQYYVTSEVDAAARRAAPYVTSLISVLERYQVLPPILSEDAEIIEAAKGAASPTLNDKLARYAEATGADAVYLMDSDGWTIAASNWNQPKTFLGQNYGFRPYFLNALSGRSGEYFAIGATTGNPGYFVSHPVTSDDGKIIGVIAVKVDLRSLESGWQGSDVRVFVANSDGVIVLSGEHGWRYRTTNPLSAEARKTIAERKQFGRETLDPLGLVREDQIVSIDKLRFVEHSADVGRLGWRLHVFSPYQRVHERSLAVMAATAVALLLILAISLFRRSERIRGLLIGSQRERDDLTRLNQELARQVEERLQAEQRLQRAQKELRQNSKLAALGQLAASVSHELGQPLAAMKTYIAGIRLPDAAIERREQADPTEIDTLLGKLDRLEQIRFNRGHILLRQSS